MVKTTGLKNYSDEHYTPAWVADTIVAWVQPTGRILEPFYGDGAFAKHATDVIPASGDFFAWQTPVDYLVSNPPYSNLTEIMAHAFAVAEHTILLVPMSKIYSSQPRMALVRDVAGIRRQLVFGSGRSIGFNTGFPFAAIEFKRGWRGPTTTDWWLA